MTLREQLIRDEGGRRPRLYYVNDIPHIGIGHNLRDVPISSAAIDLIFEDDFKDAAQALARALPWTSALSEIRREALINVVFNMGIGYIGGKSGLLSFTKMLAALKAGDDELAATHLMDSLYARQVPGRAHRVAEQLRTGVRV
jgi:lysozyme